MDYKEFNVKYEKGGTPSYDELIKIIKEIYPDNFDEKENSLEIDYTEFVPEEKGRISIAYLKKENGKLKLLRFFTRILNVKHNYSIGIEGKLKKERD